MHDFPTYASFLGAVLACQLCGVGRDMMLVISRGTGQILEYGSSALRARIGTKVAGARKHRPLSIAKRQRRLLRGFVDQVGDDSRLRGHHVMGSTFDHDSVLGACPRRHEA